MKSQGRLIIIFLVLIHLGCTEPDSVPFNQTAQGSGEAKRYLYVVSGACYGGGVTTSVGPANSIARFDLDTGILHDVLIDYNQLAPGDAPVSIKEFDENHILVLVENTSGRRIDIVNKDGSGAATYIVNSTALSAVGRNMAVLPDMSILVSKSSAVEKFSPAKSRVTSGANPFISAPGSSCATSTTLISSIAVQSNGNIVYTHAAATPNNKIGVVSSTGYVATSDCLSATAAPATTALPTRAVFHPEDGKLLVTYGSTTAASNFIYSYDVDVATGMISGATLAYSNPTIVNGPSSMAIDSESGDVFVANVTSTFNTIERFNYSSGVLSRAQSSAFISSNIYSRCVSDMQVMQ